MPEPHIERRSASRRAGATLRRRDGQLVHKQLDRRSARPGFDVAAALELQLDRFPTREGLLVLLNSWLYAAKSTDLTEHEDYIRAVQRGIDVMRGARDRRRLLPCCRDVSRSPWTSQRLS